MITLKDIAQQANVSLMTVTHVVNNTGRISEKTRLKVKKIIDELGYIPNEVARGLRSKQSKTLALITLHLNNPYVTELAAGVEEAAWNSGYRVFLLSTHGKLERELSCLHAAVSARTDGIIITPINEPNAANLKFVQKRGVPCVTTGHLPDPAVYEGSHVWSNNFDAARELALHLVSNGHRSIACVLSTGNSVTKLRSEGFISGLTEAGCYDPSLCKPFPTINEFVKFAIDHPGKPTAMFVPTNMGAIAAIEELRTYNMRVPDHIALVCFEDLPLSSRLDPLMTVMAQPAHEIGTLATEKVIHLIEHGVPKQPVITVVPSRLIVRRSCQMPTEWR